MKKPDSDLSQCFLPNFCGLRMVFVVVVIAQLFAFVVSLLDMHQQQGGLFQSLGLDSLFIQWCALASCAVMCVLRGYICRFSHRVVAVISYLTIVLVVCVVSEVAYWYVFRGASTGTSHWPFVTRNALITIILTGPILRYFYVQHQWRANVRAEAESRLQALQSRIRPHFFFNSMNTIASLTRTEPVLAEEIVEDLADLFRVSLQTDEQEVFLNDELQLCRRYLHIEQTRLGSRLQIDWSLQDENVLIKVPALSLQPLLENAIYHGIEPRVDGGIIHISSHVDADRFCLSVSNPLPPPTSRSAHRSHHIALQNIRDRLNVLYGDAGELRTERGDDQFTATLVIPVRRQESSS